MKPPTELELDRVVHLAYDPVKAHEYYEKHKKLKGRQKGGGSWESNFTKANAERHKKATAKQRQELQARIQSLSKKLVELEALIRKRAHEEASENRKGKAKKERAAKEADKPKTAAEKAKASRESEKYRDKHKQKLKSEAKRTSGSGGASKSKSESKKHSVTELTTLAAKVKGQIAVAKQKLSAL